VVPSTPGSRRGLLVADVASARETHPHGCISARCADSCPSGGRYPPTCIPRGGDGAPRRRSSASVLAFAGARVGREWWAAEKGPVPPPPLGARSPPWEGREPADLASLPPAATPALPVPRPLPAPRPGSPASASDPRLVARLGLLAAPLPRRRSPDP